MGGDRRLAGGVAFISRHAARQASSELGGMFCRWVVCPGKKRGPGVGKTKRGKGTKWMVVVDGQGVPLACHLDSASPSEVKLLEPTLDNVAVEPAEDGGPPPRPRRLVCDRGYDSDALRVRLQGERGIEVVCPH